MTILNQIIFHKKQEVAFAKKRVPFSSLKQKSSKVKFPTHRLEKTGQLQLIAEIKAKSPSAGVIRKKPDVAKLAKQFEAQGASAISVLTDKKYFGGSLKNLSTTKKVVQLPVLRKEFIINKYQIYESKVYGANIILLIATVLKNKIKDYVKLTLSLGLQPLVEVHNITELKQVLRQIKPSSQVIIGINNRDLKTFKIQLDTSLKLIKFIPKQFIRISESGVFEVNQLKQLSKAGFDAVLIGGGLVKNPNLFEYFK